MNAAELRRWLAKQGCTFESHKGGSGHVTITRGDRTSQLPMHGARKELGTGLVNQDQARSWPRMRMDTVNYPIELTPDDNGTVLATCPDLPEVTTFGEDREDALQRAADAVEEAIAARIAHRRDIPPASPARTRPAVELPALTSAKVVLYLAARAQGVSKADLARRLGWHGPQVDRLFDIRHSSKIEAIDQALRTMGKRLEVSVRDAA
jgi:antitoxin HicB